MTRTDLKLATIAGVIAWLNKHNFHDDEQALTAARRNFDHLPASLVVAACMIASDDADAGFWSSMEVFAKDSEPLVLMMDAAFSMTGDDLEHIPF